jgi:hypothetical protein
MSLYPANWDSVSQFLFDTLNQALEKRSMTPVNKEYVQQIRQTFNIVVKDSYASLDESTIGKYPTFKPTNMNAFRPDTNKDDAIAWVLFQNCTNIFNLFLLKDRSKTALLIKLVLDGSHLELALYQLEQPRFKQNAILYRKLAQNLAKHRQNPSMARTKRINPSITSNTCKTSKTKEKETRTQLATTCL